MGFRDEFERAKRWVASNFRPDKSNWEGSVFEVRIL
jgi:hypothetical protein